MKLFKTFRMRLLLILTVLLVTTLGVQFYLNYKTQKQNDILQEQKEQALLAGIALGVNSITSDSRLQTFVKKEGQSFYDKQTTDQIQDILVIDENWEVSDSLSDEYLPYYDDEGETAVYNLRDVKGLPPLMEGRERLGDDIEHFPNIIDRELRDPESGEAHAIPIETSYGRWYVIVVLKSEPNAARRAAQPLVFTLAILLFSTLITFLLVWQFTRPIADFAKAATRVADGDLDFRLKETNRSDEVGELSQQFNQMTAELQKSRELQEQLQVAEKSAVVGRLASAIAHEIRNPLNYINLSLDHLRKKFAPEDPEANRTFEKLTSQLKTEVERINQQVSDFLRYSRPQKPKIEAIQIREVVKESMRLVEPQAIEQGIKVSVIERDDTPKVAGDREILRSVVSNLLVNAMQAIEGEDGGRMSVTISSAGEWVNLKVQDSGSGVRKEDFEKIFEPYFSTKETGTGLGLAIVKKIVDEHKGEIEVESEVGEGAAFTIKLPRAE